MSSRFPSRARILAALFGAALSAASPSASADTLQTQSELSGFVRTGRYAEVGELCERFARRYPQWVRCLQFGVTPEGRKMHALAVSTGSRLTPQAAQAARIPVVLAQGAIHAGEIDGKDAGFLWLREILADGKRRAVLENQILLFVPVFNPDGHERFGRWSRPNQRGPEQMGWRVTAQNINLNRDYAKAESAEMAAMLRLVREWDPLIYIDMHVTNGAQFQHDISVQIEPVHASDAGLQEIGRSMQNGAMERLRQQGSLPLPFYMEFQETDQPASGFADNLPPPRFSHGYFHLRNRFGVLVELHSWKEYPYRVKVMRNALDAILQQSAQDGRKWLQEARAADVRASQLGGKPVALTYRTSEASRMIDFQGYAYSHSKSDISGATMVRYDETRPQVWRVPLREQIEVQNSIAAPRAGYLIPQAWAAIIAPKLDLHGIQYQRAARAGSATLLAWRASEFSFSKDSSEGRQRLEAKGEWRSETQSWPAGSLYVPINQPKARLIVALLEPGAPDAFLAWGYFNIAFEKKEYMESYVAEEVAQNMLAADPALRAAFAEKLRDPQFAADPHARLAFFASRHPSYDARWKLYPVLRLEQPLEQ
ncbi:M14 family metallopeptidase [Massilia sp. W12]|uniref:M14 family metallopeptidase n=1 Tax=Massilia sp. W12 TaxID=3126507 RepID=UPI0030D19A28